MEKTTCPAETTRHWNRQPVPPRPWSPRDHVPPRPRTITPAEVAAIRAADDRNEPYTLAEFAPFLAMTKDVMSNWGFRASHKNNETNRASASLKDPDRALTLADKVKEPARRDYSNLRVLSDSKRYDEALARVRDKKIDAWPVSCRGRAHAILATIYQLRGDDASAQEHRLKAIAAPGAEIIVRGNAATDAALHYLKQGDTRKAEEMFRQALEISPAYYAWRNTSQIALSRLLIQDHRAKEAAALFEGMAFDKVENSNSRCSLLEAYARALLAAGKKIKAIETFDILLQSGLSEAGKDRIIKELDQMAEDF